MNTPLPVLAHKLAVTPYIPTLTAVEILRELADLRAENERLMAQNERLRAELTRVRTQKGANE